MDAVFYRLCTGCWWKALAQRKVVGTMLSVTALDSIPKPVSECN